MKDNKLTPWWQEIAARGIIPVSGAGGCLELKECPECRSKYATKFQWGENFIWGCVCGWNDRYPETDMIVIAQRYKDTR